MCKLPHLPAIAYNHFQESVRTPIDALSLLELTIKPAQQILPFGINFPFLHPKRISLRAGFVRNAMGKQIGNSFEVSRRIVSIVEYMEKYHQLSV